MTKKQTKSLNTEIDQIFSGVPAAEQASLAQPEPPCVWRRLGIILVLVALLVSGGWYWFGREITLADELPLDTPLYLTLNLPRPVRWYDQFLFWQKSSRPNPAALGRLYQKALGGPGLSLFADKLELAQLSDGTFILKTKLKDKRAWLERLNVQTSGSDVKPSDLILPGRKISWIIFDHWLYLSDEPNLKDKLALWGRGQTLGSALGRRWLSSDLLTIYVSNLAFLEKLAPAYAAPLAAALTQPLLIRGQIKGQKVVWSTGRLKIDKTAAPTSGRNYDLIIFARNFSQVYTAWKNVLSQVKLSPLPANINDLERIVKEFYQLDIASFGQKLEQRQSVFYWQGGDWLFLARGEAEPAGQEISQGLEALGAVFFAITHPQAVERTLSDGSIMTELRAETEGLEWRPYTWTNALGREYVFAGLQGQGEPRGFYTGFMPELGYVLTNQPSWLTSLSDIPPPSLDLDLAVILSPRLLTNDPLILEVIKTLGIGITTSNELIGYLEF